MAGIRTIPNNVTTETTENQYLTLLVRVRRNPHTKELVAEVEAFRPKLDAALAEERGLVEADIEAGAGVLFCDQDLDASVGFIGDNVDRKSMLGMRLFGDMRPSELKKPLLGEQLHVMTAWPEALAQSDKEVLVAHAPLLAQRVEAARKAAEEKKKTSDKLADFRSVGTRVKLNEEHNALRKSLYGKLGQIQHVNKLPSGWAESFFLHESSDGVTVTELDRRIGSVEGELESLKNQRDALKAQEAKIASIRLDAARREKKAKLEALTKAKADLLARESALRAELGEGEG